MTAIATLLTALTGCPSLTLETDAGNVNSPPAITSIIADEQVLPDSGKVNFTRGLINAQMVLGLLDTDVSDTLYVRMYVNYSVQFPDPSRAECAVEPTGAVTRTCTANITNLCPDVGDDFILTVQVFDRAYAPDARPPFKGMVGNGGLSTNRSYVLNCQGEP